MTDPGERRLPDDLEAVAARLRAARVQADPLQLDQIKRRVIARCAGEQRRSSFMKSRIATIATMLGLIGGTGGALAIANNGPHGGPNGGAASGQYKPGKGCGDTNHTHTGPPGQNDNDADNTPPGGANNSAADGDKDDCGFAGGNQSSIHQTGQASPVHQTGQASHHATHRSKHHSKKHGRKHGKKH